MARRCELTGKAVLTGNNVSHAKRRTKRRFLPNLCNVTLESEALKKRVRMTISAHALRSVEHRGGLDAFLMKAGDDELSLEGAPAQARHRQEAGRAGRSRLLAARAGQHRLVSGSVNCMISVRCSALKLSSDISVSTVSPDAARWAAMRFHIVDVEAVVGIEQHLALDAARRV